MTADPAWAEALSRIRSGARTGMPVDLLDLAEGERCLPGGLIRALVRGQDVEIPISDLDPRGLRIAGLIVDEVIDLSSSS